MIGTKPITAEIRKWGLRQSKDGMIISFEIHPSDLPDALTTAPLGTRYQAVLIELSGDDDEAELNIAHLQLQAALVASEAHDGKNPGLAAASRQRYQASPPEVQAAARAAMLAKDPRFWKWADRETPFLNVGNEAEAKHFIHQRCNVISCAEFKTEPLAYEDFLKLEAKYLAETGQRAAENV